jgi:hypothetical protein
MEHTIPSDLIGSLTASTNIMRVEAQILRAEGKVARAVAVEGQLVANEEVLAKYARQGISA